MEKLVTYLDKDILEYLIINFCDHTKTLLSLRKTCKMIELILDDNNCAWVQKVLASNLKGCSKGPLMYITSEHRLMYKCCMLKTFAQNVALKNAIRILDVLNDKNVKYITFYDDKREWAKYKEFNFLYNNRTGTFQLSLRNGSKYHYSLFFINGSWKKDWNRTQTINAILWLSFNNGIDNIRKEITQTFNL
jgi:hypothetical protein